MAPAILRSRVVTLQALSPRTLLASKSVAGGLAHPEVLPELWFSVDIVAQRYAGVTDWM